MPNLAGSRKPTYPSRLCKYFAHISPSSQTYILQQLSSHILNLSTPQKCFECSRVQSLCHEKARSRIAYRRVRKSLLTASSASAGRECKSILTDSEFLSSALLSFVYSILSQSFQTRQASPVQAGLPTPASGAAAATFTNRQLSQQRHHAKECEQRAQGEFKVPLRR